ncbi:MFS transporter [Austwickia sp. TVS 96-490-7B]|uniref:MFS transporter n=1 Tax=Austwickia sp. TVS 96-490-7B TaxID=2830843 RepID=UPI00351D1F6C
MNRSVKLLVAFKVVSSASLLPVIFVLFLQGRGFSFFEIALVNSFGSLVTVLAEVPAGWMGDRYGLRRSLLCGVSVSGLGILALIGSTELLHALGAELIFCVGAALISGADTALIYNCLESSGEEGSFLKVTSQYRSNSYLASFAAKLVAPPLFGLLDILPLIVSIALCFVGLLLLSAVKDPAVAAKGEGDGSGSARGRVWGELKRGRYLRAFGGMCLASSLLTVGVSNFSVYVAPFLQSLGAESSALGLALAVGSLGGYCGSRVAPLLVNRFSERSVLVWSALGGLSTFGVAPGAGSWPVGSVFYFIITCCSAGFYTVASPVINRSIPSRWRATALSSLAMVDEAMFLLLDPVFGWTVDSFGYDIYAVWAAALAPAVLILLLLALFGRFAPGGIAGM